MTESEKWLKKKLNNYDFDPTDTLEHLLACTISSIEQYYSTNKGRSAEAVLKSSMEHGRFFLEALYDKQDAEIKQEMK